MAVPHDVNADVSGVLAHVRPAAEVNWEKELVRNCQSGDQDAFRVLVERYQSKVFSIAHQVIRSHSDVEDVAQKVFTKVYFAIEKFDFRCALITWIYRITVNECYDHLRKNRSRRTVCVSELTETESLQVDRLSSNEESAERKAELGQIVTMLLEKLSEEERTLLLMKEMEGYSIEDLASVLGWNQNTVKVKLFRARNRLADIARKKFPNLK